MKRIRGKRSGLKSQKSHWEFTQLDLAFLWVFILILMISPMFEWVGKYACDILFIPRAWLNMLIGVYLWLFILIALRLTYFLTDQRSKFKLFIIAILLCLLSINTEKTDNDGLWQPGHKHKLESTPLLKVNNNQETYIICNGQRTTLSQGMETAGTSSNRSISNTKILINRLTNPRTTQHR